MQAASIEIHVLAGPNSGRAHGLLSLLVFDHSGGLREGQGNQDIGPLIHRHQAVVVQDILQSRGGSVPE